MIYCVGILLKSVIATDEAGNSNNQLIVPKPHLPEAPNHTDLPSVKLPKVNESIDPEINDLSPQIPIMSGGENTETSRQESFLGTWEPSQELSPMHRRASTSLGIRISRIGTFLPPDSTAEDSKYSKQDDILSSMDVLKQNLSGNGFSELAEDENQFLSHEQERIDINASVSVNRSEEYQASIGKRRVSFDLLTLIIYQLQT